MPDFPPFKEPVLVETEELKPVVVPHKLDPDGTLGFKNGAAHPKTLLDIETRQLKLLFGGWTGAGYPRSLFIADLDPETLEVGNIRKFLSPADLGINSLDFAYPLYDRVNDRYLLFCFIRDTAFTDTKIAIIAMDRGLTTVQGVQKIAPTTGINDSCPCPLAFEDRFVYLLRTSSDAVKIFADTISDYTAALPLSYTEAGTDDWVAYTDKIWLEDIVPVAEMLVALVERHYGKAWSLVPFFGPPLFESFTAGTVTTRLPDLQFAYPVTSRLPLPAPLEHSVHTAHIHYSCYTKRPTLFFVYYMDQITDTAVANSWRHEIWAMRISPRDLFDVERYKPLKSVAVAGATAGKFVPVFGKDITLIVNASAAGTLTVEHYPSLYAIPQSVYATETFSLSAGYNKVNISNPGPFIRLTSDVTITGWVIHW